VIARGVVLDVRAERLLDDLALAASLGVQQVRLDVPWAAAQPKAGAFDGDVLEGVHAAASAARAAGLAPWLRLLQPAVPHWFDDEGGFADERNAGRWWPRWVAHSAEQFADVVAGWVPFEAPFAMSNRLEPADPQRHGELMHHLVVAWRDAWRILRGVVPVATSLDVAAERPDDDSPTAVAEARRRDQLRWGLWLDGLNDGIVRIPGRYERPLADFAGSCDVLGIAVRTQVETCLYRAAEQSHDRPLALTFRPVGDTDGLRAQSITAMWAEARRAGESVALQSVTVTPFVDAPGTPGIVTVDRELKDSGDAFVN
jgi:hypothetical protein